MNDATPAHAHPNVQYHDLHPREQSLAEAALQGLSQQPKRISPKYFYDRRGSELFEQICRQPEYYPTRSELSILEQHTAAIVEALNGRKSQASQTLALIELGSGASQKVRRLLEQLKPSQYCALDISRDFLLESCTTLAHDYPWLEIHAVHADYSQQLQIPENTLKGHRVAYFPGSSIGNFTPPQAQQLLQQIAQTVGPGGQLLIGVDTKKDPKILHAAYNDQAGITAAFNKNLLTRLQNELHAALDPNGFKHRADYIDPEPETLDSEQPGHIEMHLVAQGPQDIRWDGHHIHFQDGESIHTESSYKYRIEQFAQLAKDAGLDYQTHWTDPQQQFSLQLYTAQQLG